MARIRMTPEDFVVEEVALFEPTGEGTHTYLWVEKRGRDTDEIARVLAREAGVRPRDVGYAGRKDRHALTRQWFSVPGLAPERALEVDLRGGSVLRALAHPHKLRTGQLRANDFVLRVEGVDEPAFEVARVRAQEICARGLHNRFGSQRFGRDGDNASRGAAILEGRTSLRDRRQARFLVSALQSAVFNRVLASRTEPLDSLLEGDVARVEASGGLFLVEDLASELPRARAFEISATGPIFGSKMKEPAGEVARHESRILREFGVSEPLCAPRGLRIQGTRRPLRVRVDRLELRREDELRLELRFRLPAGSYATVLLEELFGVVEDARKGGS